MKKNFLLVLSLSAIAAVSLEMLAWLITPANITTVVPQDLENLYSTEEYYISGYDYSDSVYIPNNDDPQIGFCFSGRDMKTVFVEFEKPLGQDIAIQVYFAKNDEALNEANQVEVLAQKDDRIITVLLPRDIYTHIRLDINGEFSLRGIYTDTVEPEIVYKRGPVEIGRFFCGWAALFIIGWLCYCTPDIDTCINQKVGLKRHRIKKRWVICATFSIFGILLLFQVNFSNMASYSAVIPNNIAASGTLTLGTPRTIRSDEFLVSTPAFFHNSINGQLSAQALVKGSSSLIVLINNVITRLNPYYWGELYLPTSYAFSWGYLFKLFFALYTFYRLIRIITGSTWFSIIASFLLCFAPGFQWWAGPGVCGIWCGFVVLFYDYFCANKVWKKILCAWGLVCCASAVVPALYPAFDIPYIYLFLLIVIGIFATEKRINIKKTDIPYIIITCLLMAVVVTAYFISSYDTTQSMLETVYPGKRFCMGGDLPNSYWAHYLVAPLTPWTTKNFPIGYNQSEISSFLSLFPIPMAIFVAKYQDLKEQKVIKALVCFNILCDIYMVFGVGNIIAKYTLLSYTAPARLHLVWALSSFLLLLMECYYVIPKNFNNFKKYDWIGYFIVNGCVIVFLIWTVVYQGPIVNYIGAGNLVYFFAGIVLLGNLLFLGKKKVFIALICVLTIVSGAVVNPINFGTGIITDTPLAKEIRKIDSQESGSWIALDDLWMPKYVYAQGVDCLNYLSWPPRFDLFKPLDENGEFYDIYNRYAHVVVSLTEEETSFLLNQADAFTVNLNSNDLKEWGVDYVVTRGEISEKIVSVKFEVLYHDPVDNVNIYKVIYPAK